MKRTSFSLSSVSRIAGAAAVFLVACVTLAVAQPQAVRTPEGAVASFVNLSGPAAGSIEVGDVVLSVAGIRVYTSGDIESALTNFAPGDEVTVVVRKGDTVNTLSIRLMATLIEPGTVGAFLGVL